MEPERKLALIEALSSSDEETRRRSMEDLKGDLSEEDLEWMVRPLSDDSWRVRKEAIQGITGLSPSKGLVAALIPMMDPSRELTLRNSVVEVLERMGREATPFLIQHLAVDQPDIRKFLVDILGNIADVSTTPYLIELLEDPEDNIRAASAEALASIGDPSVAPSLLAAIEGADEWVIFSILGALDRLRCAAALPVFFQYLDNHVLSKPALSGIGTLGSLEDGVRLMRMVPELSRGAAKASFPAVGRIYRRHAAQDRISEAEVLRGAVEAGVREEMVDSLIGQISVSDQLDRRQDLLAVLGMVGSEKAVQAVLQYVDDDGLSWDVSLALLTVGMADVGKVVRLLDHCDPLVRRRAVQTLEQLGDSHTLEALYGKLGDESGHVRKDAARAVSKLGDSQSVGRLLPLLEDEYGDVAQSAARALVVLGKKAPEELARAIEPLKADAGPERQALFLTILTEVGAPEWEEMCLRATHDEEPAVRAAAISCLKRSKDRDAVSAVVNSLADEHPEVRVQAAATLEELKPSEALEPLKAALHDQDPWVRTAAISSFSVQPGAAPEDFEEILAAGDLMMQTSVVDGLGRMASAGKGDAFSVLERVFDEGNVETKRSVCRTLGKVGGDRATRIMMKAIGDEDSSIRAFAAYAIAQSGGEEAMEVLRKMAREDPDRGVRDAVHSILEK